MTIGLSQAAAAQFPDREGSAGLRFDAALEPGVLMHDLGPSASVLCTRFVVNASQASGGSLAIAGGADADGNPSWRVLFDAEARSIELVAGSASVSADLPGALDWHGVELCIDSANGSIALRLNGVDRGSAPAAIAPTRYAWLGAAFPDSGLVGVIDFDEWTTAPSPIGAPISSPTAEHGGDPRRWLVVYNENNADSAAWADAYRERRGVPYANLCALGLPDSETITAAEFDAMRQGIARYLNDNQLQSQVVGVLLGFGVPGYTDLDGLGQLTPITALLHTDDTHGNAVVNPLHHDPISARPSASDYAGARLTGRVDAADLPSALTLLDRADGLRDQPLRHDQSAGVIIDPEPGDPAIGPVYATLVSDWANGDAPRRLRLPLTIADPTPIDQVLDEAVVWGWQHAAPPASFFARPAGRRAVCLQLHPHPQPAVSARTPAGSDWLSAALSAGYAAAAAASRPYSLSVLPLPHLFFEALREGWTLAEAWLVAQPLVRGGVQILGDPLTTIRFPKAGYDVLGPAQRLDQIDPDRPLAVLHAGQRSLQLTPADAPGPGEAARYLVRRIDQEGRGDHAATSLYVALTGDKVITPAPPAWPDTERWRLTERGDMLHATAVWPSALSGLQIDRVTLEAQAGTSAPFMIETLTPVPDQRCAHFVFHRPSLATRYRFLVEQAGHTTQTPWSTTTSPVTTPDASVTTLEPRP